MEISPLKYQATRLRFLRQMRGFSGLFLVFGRTTYSYCDAPISGGLVDNPSTRGIFLR